MSELPPSQLPPIPEFVRPVLRVNSTLISEGLVSGLLDPLQLNPSRSEHVAGLLRAARQHPTLPIPPAFLAKIDERTLWSACSHPTIATHLVEHLRQHGTGCTFTGSLLQSRKAPLPNPIEAALLDLARHERLTSAQISALRTLPAFSTAGRAALLAVIRSQASKQAAITRKQRHQQAAAAPTPSEPSTGTPPSPPPAPKIDPLLKAIRSGNPARFQPFFLPRLDPARVRAVLPEWLTAPSPVKALLLKIPGLPLDAKLLALEAWADTHCYVHPVDPVDTSLLARLSPTTLDKVLTSWLRNTLQLTPSPDDAALQNPLFCLALDHPDRAMWLRNGIHLRRWLTQLKDLLSTPPPSPIPSDPEAQWIHLLAKCSDMESTQTLGLAVMHLFQTWPAPRQHALTPLLHKIATHTITAI